MRLSRDGDTLSVELYRDPQSAPLAWLYVPGYGRYTLSLAPYAGQSTQGVESIGEVSGNTLTLPDGRPLFRVESAEIVAAGSYRAYAHKDAAWLPPDPLDRNFVLIGELH